MLASAVRVLLVVSGRGLPEAEDEVQYSTVLVYYSHKSGSRLHVAEPHHKNNRLSACHRLSHSMHSLLGSLSLVTILLQSFKTTVLVNISLPTPNVFSFLNIELFSNLDLSGHILVLCLRI